MIDKPVSPAGTTPATFTPLVRAVIDSVTEGIVVFDPQGRLRLYAGHGQSADVFAHELTPGIYGLSNEFLDTP